MKVLTPEKYGLWPLKMKMMGLHGRMDFHFPRVSNLRCKGGFCKNAWWRSHQFTSPQAFPTVDGCNQLRLIVHPMIYKVWYIPGGCLGFLNHQLYEHCGMLRGWFNFVWGWETTEHPGVDPSHWKIYISLIKVCFDDSNKSALWTKAVMVSMVWLQPHMALQ